ncbi:hypothetical protein Tco_0389390 [Tanacetum coccineum]
MLVGFCRHGGLHLYLGASKKLALHTDADIDEVKEDNKRLRKELSLLRSVVKSYDRMSQLFTQWVSLHEIGRVGRSGPAGCMRSRLDEDADGDEEI